MDDDKPSVSSKNNVENSDRSSALSDNDSDTCSSGGFEPEQSFSEWAKKLDVDNFPDPNLFPVLKDGSTEEGFRKIWQQKTGQVIKHFSDFTIPQG